MRKIMIRIIKTMKKNGEQQKLGKAKKNVVQKEECALGLMPMKQQNLSRQQVSNDMNFGACKNDEQGVE